MSGFEDEQWRTPKARQLNSWSANNEKCCS